MNDADKKAFETAAKDWATKSAGKDLGEYFWQACCEWRDSNETTWRNAAIRVGEDLHSVGPDGYYKMTAEQWLNWALKTIYSKPNFGPPTAQINQQMLEAIQAAIDCGMVPNSSAKEGGAAKHSIQVHVADQLREALAYAKRQNK